MIRVHWLLWSALLAPTVGTGQDAHNANQWFGYWGDHRLGQSKWDLHFDTHVRTNGLLARRQQMVARPGVNYTIHPRVQLHGAFGWIPSYSYGRAPLQPQMERRLLEQIVVQLGGGSWQWTHRGRFEQRWLRRDGEPGAFEQRVRYTLRATRALAHGRYWSLGDEILVPVKPETHPATADQNRVVFTIGQRLNQNLRIEFTYMLQSIWQRNGYVREHNHVLGIAVFHNTPLGQLLRRLR